MNIGILGFGKMGRDIFSHLFGKLKTDSFIVLDICSSENNYSEVMKTLDKSLKRKKISEKEYEFKKNSFSFTDDVSELIDCDIIIEAVFEKLDVKNELFRKIADVVSEKCLLLTNTSSLCISDIFSGIPHIERCFGMHFFYPVKLSGFTELNVLPETKQEYISLAADLVKNFGKTPIIFPERFHLCLNQVLADTVFCSIFLCDKYGVSAAELESSLNKLFPVIGIFGILDSIGLGLISGNSQITDKNDIHRYGLSAIRKWLGMGCPQTPHAFLDFMSQHETPTNNPCDGAKLDMAAFILNEAVNILKNYGGDSATFMDAVCDILGTAEGLPFYYQKFGADMLFSALDELKNRSGFNSFEHKDKSFWDKFLSIQTQKEV